MKSLRQIQNKKQFPIVPVLATVLGTVVIAAAVWIFFFNKSAPTQNPGLDGTNTVNYDPPTEEEKQATEKQKEEIIAREETTTTPELGVIISRSFQEAGLYQVRTYVTGTASGECVATFTKTGQQTITKTFVVSFEATSAFCKDAAVPVSEFATGGAWSLSLIVKHDGKQSEAATTTVEITK